MKSTNAPEIKLNIVNNAVDFSVSDGWHAEFIGADFTQLVDDDLNIHTPINDMTAVLSFKCSKGSIVTEKDCTLNIKGKYGAAEKKPNVIPEPAQWHSTNGVLKKLNSFSCNDDLFDIVSAFADELYSKTEINIVRADKGTVDFSIDGGLKYLGEEGYEIICTQTEIKVLAASKTGIIWAGKTICQLMSQGGFPCGIMRDYPRYSVRGFMLDVGRKPVSLNMLEKIVNKMAWYKLNDFQIHLSDNYIWLEDYAENGDESTYNAYQAFRLESDLKNSEGKSASSNDYCYSKAEFNEFIKASLKKGVKIVPEIDMPAHALAFTKVFPEYAVTNQVSILMKKRPLTDHIDVSRPEAVDFVKRIFDEYIKGDEPVFPDGTTVHIGADEFLSNYTAYRNFINEIVPYIKKNNPVRLWGGLTWIKDKPETAIVKEAIDDVQMNLWNNDWADGREMYDMGFKLINTIDNLLYIVPNGTKIRAPYMDFINKRRAFKCFEPNRVRLKNKGKYVNLPAGNKQVLGGCFAIWQDNIDKRSKGITELDLFERFIDSAAFMAEINWGSCTDKKSSLSVDLADKEINNSVKSKRNIFESLNNIKLIGANSFYETEFGSLPVGSKLNIKLKLEEVVPGQILMEADAPYGTYDIRITDNYKLGFTSEWYEYEFDYKLVPNKQLDLTIETKPLRTVLKSGLFVNKHAKGSYSFEGMVRNNNIKNTTFSIPVQRIGSKTNSVKAEIYSISVK